jgi:hypothetical protein
MISALTLNSFCGYCCILKFAANPEHFNLINDLQCVSSCRSNFSRYTSGVHTYKPFAFCNTYLLNNKTTTSRREFQLILTNLKPFMRNTVSDTNMHKNYQNTYAGGPNCNESIDFSRHLHQIRRNLRSAFVVRFMDKVLWPVPIHN